MDCTPGVHAMHLNRGFVWVSADRSMALLCSGIVQLAPREGRGLAVRVRSNSMASCAQSPLVCQNCVYASSEQRGLSQGKHGGIRGLS